MSRIWAIARLTIAEGLRMKVALVFLVLIATVIIGLPFSDDTGNSLTHTVQSFMSFGLTATAVLLSLLTIFMARSLSDEVVSQQIFLTATKPIPRWQYVLGKWVGMMVLNLAFLVCAGATIYGMIYYIKATVPPSDERYDLAELNNEVLVARHAIKMDMPDFSADAELEFQRNLEQGAYARIPDFNADEEKRRLAVKHEMRWRIVGPYDARVFEFKNILCSRSPDDWIQLRYKSEVSQYPLDEIFRAHWEFGDPYKGVPVFSSDTRHVVGRYHTIRVPADVVAPDNTLQVRFYNVNNTPGEKQASNVMDFRRSDPVEILFTVGSFEWNFVRLLSLILFKLMFLGAVALLCATVFSFPVACLCSFTVYILAGTHSFITDSFDLATHELTSMFSSIQEFLTRAFAYLYEMLFWILPDFAKYDAVESFVNGRNVGLVWVLQGFSELVVIKTLLVLGIAMLLFQRREVAEISF